MGDADLLLALRNDPATLSASHNGVVDRETHLRWLGQMLSREDRRIYIAEKEGIALGTVRAEWIEGAWKLSWIVLEEARGCGVGKAMVALAVEDLAAPVRAEVKCGNEASAHIAEHAGMICVGEREGFLDYRREC